MKKRHFAGFLSVLLIAAGTAADQQDELTLVNKYKMVESFVQKAQKFVDQEKFDQCDVELAKCFEAVPDHHSAHFVKAQELYKRGEFAAALERIGRAKDGFRRMGAAILTLQQNKLRNDIDRAQEMSDYGEALGAWYEVAACMKTTVQSWMIDNEKKMSDNEKGIQERMSGGPKDVVPAEYHYFAGNCFFKMKRLDEAAGLYEAALAVNPAHANACNNLINILYVQKRLEDARAWLARAEKAKVKIHPGLKKAVLEK